MPAKSPAFRAVSEDLLLTVRLVTPAKSVSVIAEQVDLPDTAAMIASRISGVRSQRGVAAVVKDLLVISSVELQPALS